VKSTAKAIVSHRRGLAGTAQRKQGKVAHLFLLPWLLGLVLITLVPLAASLYLSFTDYNLLSSPNFIGLGNFSEMFSDVRFWHAVVVTIKYVLISVPLQLAFALLLAMVLDKGFHGTSFYRSAFYLPSLLGSSVALAIIWRQIFGSDGIVNSILSVIGIGGTNWLQNPATALDTLVVLNVWTFGSPMIIFLAGLRQIPREMHESAEVDGAGPVRKFRSITIPLLSPLIFFNLVLQTINAFQAFTQASVVSRGTGGPVDSTLFYTLYLYQQAFLNYQMGYASAMAWVLLVVVGLITAGHFFASKYWVFYSDGS